MYRSNALIAVLALCAGLIPDLAAAEVRLPALFSDHMVLQQQMPLSVWGWAEPGEAVTVRFRAQQAQATAETDGRWSVLLQPELPGDPAQLFVIGRTGSVTLSDVVVGEVWVASGQSNMQFTVAQSERGAEEAAAARSETIRLFSVARVTSVTARDDVAPATWQRVAPETVKGFSAVGFFFARELTEARRVPVGIIHASWGGTPAEAWTRLSTLERDPALQPILWQWRRLEAEFPSASGGYERRKPIWDDAARSRAALSLETPPGQPMPRGGPTDPHAPGSLFNGMIAPLTRFAIRGVIWYQGETNAVRAWDYQRLFTTMIEDWRQAWNRGTFPFLFVQLANYEPTPITEGVSWWSAVREAQVLTLGVPNTGMAVTIDIGNPADIHPLNKPDVGRRLALAARGVAYGEPLTYSGPIFSGMTIEGSRIRVRFRHVGKGLQLRGDAPAAFLVAGVDGRFATARATIDGEALVVSSPDVPAPVTVRYAWRDNPAPVLWNLDGLPASPFRTDTWDPRETLLAEPSARR